MNRQKSTVDEELDRYLSQENLAALDESKERTNQKIERLEEVVQEFTYWFIPEIFKGIKKLKSNQQVSIETQRNELNSKIYTNVALEYQKGYRFCRNQQEHNLQLLQPFEQSNPQIKATNMMKALNKKMQQVQHYLNQMSEITTRMQELLKKQNCNQLGISQTAKSKIKFIAQEMSLCGLGDRVDKFLERCLRWHQYPCANMQLTMEKIVEFDAFIVSEILAEQQVRDQKIQDSQEKEELQEEHQEESNRIDID